MILKRFYDNGLAQASFMIGSEGQAAVIDANRDVEQYINAAASEGLRITAVTETHIHADYVSGSRELAERTGAQLYLSDEGDDEWKYAFANQPNVTLVRDGDTIQVGKVRLDVMKTPGHTNEHISFVVTDTAVCDQPLGVFTGDFIFAGDVGRPDLLERAAGYEGTMEVGARTLFRSIQQFKASLPDSVLIWPGHGAGSACGKNLGAVPVSTLGYEKLANWGLKSPTEEDFVKTVLEGQPEPPKYFKEMKRLNKIGPPILGGFKVPPRLGGNVIFDLLERNDVVVVDIRSAGDVASGYVPGTINIPLSKSFSTYSGWILSYDQPIYLIAENQHDATAAVRELAMIGLDDVRGWMGIDAVRQYEKRFGEIAMVAQVSAHEMKERLDAGKAHVLDVRGMSEFSEAHVPGAINIPLGYLPDRVAELPPKPLIVHCGGGTRSAIAATILHKAGRTDIANLPGGFMEYRDLGYPIEIGIASATTKV